MSQDNSKCVVVERQDSVGVIWIDCPPANSFTPDLIRDLSNSLKDLGSDSKIRALLLASRRGSVFLSGGDIKFSAAKIRNGDVEGEVEYVRSIQQVTLAVDQIPKPMVCCINGHALGGGFELAMACDFRYAAQDVLIGIPEVELGFMPAVGGLQRIARKFGTHLALRMAMGLRLTAQEALKLGLVDKVTAPTSVFEESLSFSHQLAQLPTVAVGMIKKALYEGFTMAMNDALRLELRCLGTVLRTRDAAEGVEAYLGKRQPAFRGE